MIDRRGMEVVWNLYMSRRIILSCGKKRYIDMYND